MNHPLLVRESVFMTHFLLEFPLSVLFCRTLRHRQCWVHLTPPLQFVLTQYDSCSVFSAPVSHWTESDSSVVKQDTAALCWGLNRNITRCERGVIYILSPAHDPHYVV